MREMSVTLGKLTLPLRANFRSSMLLCGTVGDPLMIAREAVLEAMIAERGLDYKPKFTFTLPNIVQTIFIGANEYNSEITKAQIEDAVFDAGMFEARDIASNYIALIIGESPELEGTMKTAEAGK